MNTWEESEIKLAVKLIQDGLSYYEISKIVNRTKQSVRIKLNKMGYYVIPKNLHVEKKCLTCDNNFLSLKSENRKFCSLSCSSIHNNRLRKKSEVTSIKNVESTNNQNFSKKNCKNCGHILINNKNTYCNQDCVIEFKRKEVFEQIEMGNSDLYYKNYKKYLIHKHGEKCMECGWGEVNEYTGKIPIELEHIDGNSKNNELSNLKLLCPNCHSLTPTYKGANRGNGRHYRRERYQEGKSF